LMCLGVGLLESLVTRPEITTWYASLYQAVLDAPSSGIPDHLDDPLYLDGR
jgi:hypothetical protein